MESEFGSVKLLVSVDQLPNLKLILIEGTRDHKSLVRVSSPPITSNKVGGIPQLND